MTGVEVEDVDDVAAVVDEAMRALACCRLVVATTAMTAIKRMMVADDAICLCIYIWLVDKVANNVSCC